MISQDKLTKLYGCIINKEELTTKDLNSCGFSSKDITTMIEQGKLERIKRGYYSFLSLDDLVCYGRQLIDQKQFSEAKHCFLRCYEIDSNNYDVCYQLFIRSIDDSDYPNAFKYINFLSKTENPYYRNEINFYLYLLSFITDMPEEYNKVAREFEIEDIIIASNDIRYNDVLSQNKIRLCALQCKFSLATKQLSDLINNNNKMTAVDLIAYKLLDRIVRQEKQSKKKLQSLIIDNKYCEIVEYLHQKEQNHNLSYFDNYILKLTNKILEIEETKEIPTPIISTTNSLFTAIDGCNYELALYLSEKKEKRGNEKNLMALLLNNLCDLINDVEMAEIEDKNITNFSEQDQTTFQSSQTRVIDKDEIFIKEKHRELVNNQGIILLTKKQSKDTDKIISLVSKYKDITPFIIGSGDDKQIVLRYRPFSKEPIDYKDLIEKGKNSYFEGRYDDSITAHLRLLQIKQPSESIYANIGLAYLKKGNIKMALDYFVVATELSRQRNGKYDFTEMIAKLKGNELGEEEEVKSYVKMDVSEFTNDVNNYYNIDDIEGITYFITETGLDVENACKFLGMSSEQIDTVNLIYAREYYSQGNYEMGDKFLKTVEKSKNKTEFTNGLFDEVRANKKFYVNRSNEKPLQLTLRFRPTATSK